MTARCTGRTARAESGTPGFETGEDLQVYRNSSLVLRWDPGSGVVSLATDTAGSCNGLAFSPDESILYVNDKSARAASTPSRWRPTGRSATSTCSRPTRGDATKVDVAGNVYCTGSEAVQVHDPAGQLLGRIPVPEKHSNLAWGEEGWSTLFVTSGSSVYRSRRRPTASPSERRRSMGWRFERLVDDVGDVLDGPVWDGSGVLFCCPGRNAIHRWDAGTGDCMLVRHPTVRIRGLAFDPDGRLFAAQSRARRDGLAERRGRHVLPGQAMLDGRRHNDPQDLVVDRGGRIWFTDRYTDDSIPGPVGYPPLEHRSVLRLTEHDRPHDGWLGKWTLERMSFDTAEPSGIALSPDERTLYVIDRDNAAERSRLKGYRISTTDHLGPPRVLHEFDRGTTAGGMCVDRRGRIVVTTPVVDGGGGLVVFDPDGRGPRVCRSATRRPTAATAAADGGTLYVTTSTGRLLAAAPRRG